MAVPPFVRRDTSEVSQDFSDAAENLCPFENLLQGLGESNLTACYSFQVPQNVCYNSDFSTCVYIHVHTCKCWCMSVHVCRGVRKKSQGPTSGMLSTLSEKGSLSGLEFTKGKLGWLLSSGDLPVSVSPALGVQFSKFLNSRGSSRVFISKLKQSLCRR